MRLPLFLTFVPDGRLYLLGGNVFFCCCCWYFVVVVSYNLKLGKTNVQEISSNDLL